MELTSKELQNIRRELEEKNAVFSDKKYLDSLFLPSSIIGRKDEAKMLLSHIEGARKGLVVPLISVYGRSGSGKSTLVKFVCENITDIASYVFVNLRKSRTVFGCANMILSELGVEPLKNAQGINLVIEKIGQRILEIASEKKIFFLVLDEYDSVFSDPRGKPSDFIYKLLTMEEELREREILVSIITISNNALNDFQLDDRVKSRAGSTEVFFTPYLESDLTGILRDRAEKAFAIKISDDVIEYCAKISFHDHGDARRGLDVLRVAGELCDGKTVTMIDINSAHEQLQKDKATTIVSSLSLQQKTLAFAICIETLYSKSGWVSTSKIYERYVQIVDNGLWVLTQRRVVDLLVDLKNTGLLASTKQLRDMGGYGIEYRLMFSPDDVALMISKEKWYYFINEKNGKESEVENMRRWAERQEEEQKYEDKINRITERVNRLTSNHAKKNHFIP